MSNFGFDNDTPIEVDQLFKDSSGLLQLNFRVVDEATSPRLFDIAARTRNLVHYFQPENQVEMDY